MHSCSCLCDIFTSFSNTIAAISHEKPYNIALKSLACTSFPSIESDVLKLFTTQKGYPVSKGLFVGVVPCHYSCICGRVLRSI